MKLREVSTLLMALLLVIALFVGTNAALVSSANSPSFGPAPVTFNGTINITADGGVIYHGTGNTSIVERNGNFYTLNGNVYGAINIMHNYTVLNGRNFSISNSSVDQNFSLTVSGASHVSVEFLKINTAYQPGIFVNVSSNDTFSWVNVSSAQVSLLVGAHTDHLSFVNSEFSLNTSKIAQTFETNTVVTGATSPAIGSSFVNSSSSIMFLNDTISNMALNTAGAGITLNSASTMIDNVTLKLLTYNAIAVLENNTTIVNSHFNGYAQYGVDAFPFSGGMLANLNLLDNTFNLTAKNLPYGEPIEAIDAGYSNLTMKGNIMDIGNPPSSATGSLFYTLKSSNSNLKLTNNRMELNNTGYNQASGLDVRGGNLSLEGNYISMLNTELDSNYAVQAYDVNITAANNTIFYQSDSPSITGYGIDSSGGLLIADRNSVVSSGASIIGISATGNSRLSITGNAFNLSNSPVLEAISMNSISSGSQNNVSRNSVLEGTPSSSAVGFDLSSVKNLTLQDNTLSQSGGSSPYYGLQTDGLSNSTISGNAFTGPQNIPELGYGLSLKDAKNVTFANNTLSSYNITLYSASSSNLNFYGNYFSKTFIAMNMTSTNNSTFYHNDFTVQNSHSLRISSSSNDTFNLALPVGGNYWSSYTGSDANGDGIGDSSFTVNGTFVDHYPLMKPWTRPMAIFIAPSGINGTLWSVTFNGKTLQSTGREISFNIMNATYQNYSFEYHNTSLYYISEQAGYFNYEGTGIALNVPYLHYSYITGDLNLSGLTVYVNGKLVYVIDGKFNLTVTAGQYNVVIMSPGYATFNHTYNLTPGVTLHISPILEKIPANNFRLILEYAIAIIAVLAVAGGVAFYLRGRKKI